jgi:quaternary ammonium compound-resistance protein SugE
MRMASRGSGGARSASPPLVSFVLLATALKSLPVGTAYAVWVGVGALGVALTGIIALGECASLLRLAFLALILIGIVGLKLVEG